MWVCGRCKQVFFWLDWADIQGRHIGPKNAIVCSADAVRADDAVQVAYQLGGPPAALALLPGYKHFRPNGAGGDPCQRLTK